MECVQCSNPIPEDEEWNDGVDNYCQDCRNDLVSSRMESRYDRD